MRIIKFLITGGIGLTVNLGTFRILEFFEVPYLAGSVGAFLLAMCTGFVLQKYWTFEDRSFERAHVQLALYAGLALVNLTVNTGIVYVLVAYASTHYLIAQTIGAGVVAIASYFFYKLYIFRSAV
jgi:dolichol-phosphate mannosyltransferase